MARKFSPIAAGFAWADPNAGSLPECGNGENSQFPASHKVTQTRFSPDVPCCLGDFAHQSASGRLTTP